MFPAKIVCAAPGFLHRVVSVERDIPAYPEESRKQRHPKTDGYKIAKTI
jgi:hypothetical protein